MEYRRTAITFDSMEKTENFIRIVYVWFVFVIFYVFDSFRRGRGIGRLNFPVYHYQVYALIQPVACLRIPRVWLQNHSLYNLHHLDKASGLGLVNEEERTLLPCYFVSRQPHIFRALLFLRTSTPFHLASRRPESARCSLGRMHRPFLKA